MKHPFVSFYWTSKNKLNISKNALSLSHSLNCDHLPSILIKAHCTIFGIEVKNG